MTAIALLAVSLIASVIFGSFCRIGRGNHRAMSNYPDDIHRYDTDPRSPFYYDGGYEQEVDRVVKEMYTECINGDENSSVALFHDALIDAANYATGEAAIAALQRIAKNDKTDTGQTIRAYLQDWCNNNHGVE